MCMGCVHMLVVSAHSACMCIYVKCMNRGMHVSTYTRGPLNVWFHCMCVHLWEQTYVQVYTCVYGHVPCT